MTVCSATCCCRWSESCIVSTRFPSKIIFSFIPYRGPDHTMRIKGLCYSIWNALLLISLSIRKFSSKIFSLVKLRCVLFCKANTPSSSTTLRVSLLYLALTLCDIQAMLYFSHRVTDLSPLSSVGSLRARIILGSCLCIHILAQ